MLYEYDEGGQWRERGRGEMRVNVAHASGQVLLRRLLLGFSTTSSKYMPSLGQDFAPLRPCSLSGPATV